MTAKKKSTDTECDIQKYCQGVPRLKYIQGVPQTKVQQGSAIIKMIDRECKSTAREHFGTNLVQKILSESATIRRTTRKCHNQKNIKKVQQSKVLPGSVTIKSSVRECHNHGYCQAVP